MKILVVDIGGSHIKLATSEVAIRRLDTPKDLGPGRLVELVQAEAPSPDYEAVSLGYPGLVGPKGPRADPPNLGNGWVGFDFEKAFDRPVKVLNDAAMQAPGSYEGGRMLFLGLGTGVGSTLVTDRVVVPLELGDLAYVDGNVVDVLSKDAFHRDRGAWLRAVGRIVPNLRAAFAADYVMLGGGHAEEVDPLPKGARRGGNENAIAGGIRLWENVVLHAKHAPAPEVWRVVA